MDRRLLLPLVLGLGCAQGNLEGPGSFGLPNTATMTTQSDTEDDDDEDDDDDGETEDETENGDGDGDGDTGPSTQSSTDPSTADDDGSTSAPVTTAEDSSGDSASQDDSASASAEESSSTDPIDPTDATNDDGMDDGVDPPADAGAWENCEAAVCELGNDCITVNGVVGEAYCAPQCVTDLDCPFPDTGDATPMCLLVGEGAVDPTNCTLVCEVDGLDYGTCPNGMTCTSVPGQDPSISLCMW